MTTVGILGVMHDDETRRKYNWGLDVIEELILEFHPDVICGEVLPGSWERYKRNRNDRGYWGEPAIRRDRKGEVRVAGAPEPASPLIPMGVQTYDHDSADQEHGQAAPGGTLIVHRRRRP
jgi:hypothetical protein